MSPTELSRSRAGMTKAESATFARGKLNFLLELPLLIKDTLAKGNGGRVRLRPTATLFRITLN